jgi:DnaK suppressor protein
MAEAKSKRAARLEAIILEKKRQMWNEVREDLFRKTGEELHTQQEIPQDVGDQGLLDLMADMGLSIADIRREELTRMEETERKFREGTYGICDDCGREIAEERLAASPFVLFCIDCQKRREGPPYPPGLTL